MKGVEKMVQHITEILTSFGQWVVSSLQSIIPVFYDSENGLTIFGILALGSLAIGIFMMLIGVLQNFLHFRS